MPHFTKILTQPTAFIVGELYSRSDARSHGVTRTPDSIGVGGAPGYFELLEALNDVKHSEHESYREWVGGSFDPEGFDLKLVNSRR